MDLDDEGLNSCEALLAAKSSLWSLRALKGKNARDEAVSYMTSLWDNAGGYGLTLIICVLFSCTSSSTQNVSIPDVTTLFEIIVDPNEDASFVVKDVINVKILLTGAIDASFTIFINAVSTNPNDKTITADYDFNKLSGDEEIKTEWYGDPMRIVYQPLADVSGGDLAIAVTFCAVH